MTQCPYCGGKLAGDHILPPLTAMQQKIYKTIVLAGPDGIESNILRQLVHAEGQSAVSIRTLIHNLNKRLKLAGKNHEIRGRQHVYRLMQVADAVGR